MPKHVVCIIYMCVELASQVNYSSSVANWLICQQTIPMQWVRHHCLLYIIPYYSLFIQPNVTFVSAHTIICQPLMWWTIRLSRGSIYRSTSVEPFDLAAWWDLHTMHFATAGSYDGVLCTIDTIARWWSVMESMQVVWLRAHKRMGCPTRDSPA